MRIINKKTGEILGTITTNHSMAIHEACEMCNVDLDEVDVDDLHLSTYEESHEIAGAEECARESVKAGIVDMALATASDGEPLAGTMGEHESMPDGDYVWLREKFGFVTHSMCRAYRSSWNAAIEAASAA